jgi:hypothetical protein
VVSAAQQPAEAGSGEVQLPPDWLAEPPACGLPAGAACLATCWMSRRRTRQATTACELQAALRSVLRVAARVSAPPSPRPHCHGPPR